MNYKKIHDKIIRIAKSREKHLTVFERFNMERHHIKPRCKTGDKKWQGDVVYLWPREHYIIHQLLVKIDKKNPNLVFALHRLAHASAAAKNDIKYYSWIKLKVSKRIAENNRIPKKKKKVA